MNLFLVFCLGWFIGHRVACYLIRRARIRQREAIKKAIYDAVMVGPMRDLEFRLNRVLGDL